MKPGRCLICTFSEAAHPEVGNGYVPHPFQPADLVVTPAYTGPERRRLVRRMSDRIVAVERAVARAYPERTAR